MDIRRVGMLAVFIIIVLLFYYFDLHHFLTLNSLRDHHAYLLELYRSHPYATMTVFILVYALQTALFLPADIFLSLLGGAIFGVFVGTIVVNIGATAGATLGFIAVRYVFRGIVQKKMGRKLEAMNSVLSNHGLQSIVLLRLIPIFPFVLITLGAALTATTIRNFVLGTMVGIIPGSILFCNAGASLAAISSTDDIMSPRVVLSLTVLGLFSVLPVLYRRLKLKQL